MKIDCKWRFEHIKYECPHSKSRKARGKSRERRLLFTGCSAFVYAKYSRIHDCIQISKLNLNHSGHDLSDECLFVTDPSRRKIDVNNKDLKMLIDNDIKPDRLLDFVRNVQNNSYITKKDLNNAKN